MGLVISLKKDKTDAMFSKVAMAIALESYRDLQNGYGFLMRKQNLIDIEKLIQLINYFDRIKEGEDLLFDEEAIVLYYTCFNLALKSLQSHEPDRFFHAFANDAVKRERVKNDLLEFCKEMLVEISEQSIMRYEVEQQKILLADFIYD